MSPLALSLAGIPSAERTRVWGMHGNLLAMVVGVTPSTLTRGCCVVRSGQNARLSHIVTSCHIFSSRFSSLTNRQSAPSAIIVHGST